MSNKDTVSNSFYDTKTLLCKNKCGFYGNSMQYEGYCSICYRKLKSNKSTKSYPTFMTSSSSFDDSTSLLTSSQSFSIDDKKSNYNQYWNEHSNFNKFSAKADKRKSSALNKIFRRPSSSTSGNMHQYQQHSSLNLVDTMSKVADKAVNLVDQSFQSSLNSLNSSNTFQFLSPSLNGENLVDFINIMNKLLKPSPPCGDINSSAILVSSTLSKTSIFSAQSNENILKEFEEKFRLNFPHIYADIVKQIKNFLDKFKEIVGKDTESSDLLSLNTKHSEMVQDFYRKMNKHLITSGSIKLFLDKLSFFTKPISLNNEPTVDSTENQTNINNEDSEKFSEAVMIMIESYVNNNIYDLVFPSLMSEFEEQDIKLQKKIRRFYWINSEMIGTCIDENSVFYRDPYEEAINNIVQVDSKRTSYEKMLCITNCSKNLFNAINIASNIKNSVNQASSSDPKASKNKNNLASADDFLPALIYLVLKANPTMLYSNINFVTRFAFEKRILQGEHAYHFCSLNAVIAHIENLDRAHLNMTKELFDYYSNGQNDTDNIGNIQKVIETNLKVLSELKDKQVLIKHETFKLQSDIQLFRQLIKTKLQNCAQSSTAIKFSNSFENKSVLDDSQDVASFNATSNSILQPVPLKN